MVRFTSKIFGVTVLALGLIWFASPGDANQASAEGPQELWANVYVDNQGDTVHINIGGESNTETQEMPERASQDRFMRQVKKLTKTAFDIRNSYVEDVDMEEILDAGIRGMLSNLDRYSVLMEEEAYEALMESTRGNYQGLGLQIDSHGDYITIVTPIEGTPAYRKGLRAGDVIQEIEGVSTLGWTSSEAADKMRGEAGTSVNLSIKRSGIAELMAFEVERAVITLKSVNYYGVIPGTDIGYLRLSRFAEETGNELRQAITELNDLNISSLVFDLRSNGGGLLDQAIETAELFLPVGSEIVYTRGQDASSEQHMKSQRPPIFPPDKALVILVDEGTASASEIVSGAVQDWDRGLIVGATTYGKGLVQRLFQFAPGENEAVKLTTARYYVPSGRCIQRPERQAKAGATDVTTEDSESDSLTISEREVFYTNGGRMVFGGGGIVPDVEVEREIWQPVEINLERQSMFFDFSIEYLADHPDIKPDFEVTDELLEEFRAYVESRDFTYKTSVQVALEELQETVNDNDATDVFATALDDMMVLVEGSKQSDFDDSREYIGRAVKREIVRAIAGERGVYEQIILKNNKTVQKALELLGTPVEYSRLITEGQDQNEM